MKTYYVSFYYTEYGKVTVKANSSKQAEEKVYKELEENGLENLDYDSKDRDYDTTDVDVA